MFFAKLLDYIIFAKINLKMKENIFVRQNKKKWLKYEKEIKHLGTLSTQRIADLYQDVTADLSYSQSQFPEGRVTSYLNNMALSLHDYVYTPRKTDFIHSTIHFFSYVIPKYVAEARFEFRLSFFIFLAFTIAGVILAVQDMENIINTLGPSYVNMTLENIKNGVPTDVYGNTDETDMFLFIVLKV